jgi:hypothetical protein
VLSKSWEGVRLGAVLVVVLLMCREAGAGVINFSDQAAGDGPMLRATPIAGEASNVYNANQGLPATATFVGGNTGANFDRFGFMLGQSFIKTDPTNGGSASYRGLEIVTATAEVTFDQSVQVSSLDYDITKAPEFPADSSGDPGYLLQIVGSQWSAALQQEVAVWTWTLKWPNYPGTSSPWNPNGPPFFVGVAGWNLMTNGAGYSINQLTFSNANSVGIDDINVLSVPEPGALYGLACYGAGTLLRRPLKRRLRLRSACARLDQ